MQLIGNELAIVWDDGSEGYITGPALRAASPSAATAGEKDIFGNKYGGEDNADYSAVEITGWELTGNYAARFQFSDGHGSGIYSWDLLRKLTQGS